MSGSANAGTTAERHTCELGDSKANGARSQERALGSTTFLLDERLTWMSVRGNQTIVGHVAPIVCQMCAGHLYFAPAGESRAF